MVSVKTSRMGIVYSERTVVGQVTEGQPSGMVTAPLDGISGVTALGSVCPSLCTRGNYSRVVKRCQAGPTSQKLRSFRCKLRYINKLLSCNVYKRLRIDFVVCQGLFAATAGPGNLK